MGRAQNACGYGLLSDSDVLILEKSLDVLVSTFKDDHLVILEIGMFWGNTMRSIKKKLDSMYADFECWSIDNGSDGNPQNPAFEGCNLITGDSIEAFVHVPNKLHWVFIDGCHCVNHVMLDFLHYSDKLVEGGIILFHDTSPKVPFTHKSHGPYLYRQLGGTVLEGLRKLDIKNNKHFTLLSEGYDADKKWGGITAFQKIKQKIV